LTGARAGRAQASDTTRGGHPKAVNVVETRDGTAKLELALLYDVSTFGQNDASVSQVGNVPTVGEVRTDRIIIDGTIGRARRPVRYLFSVDVNALQANVSTGFTLNDLAVTIPLGSVAWLALGRQKESISEEMLASTRTLPHVERSAAVLAFIPTRNDGIRLWGTISTDEHGSGGWTLGVFNDCIFNGLSLAANGEQVSGRVFWAPPLSDDTTRVFQLALNGRWTDDRNGTIRFKAKPEVFESPNFINTGDITASGAALGDAGLLLQEGSWSLSAEALPVRVTGAEPRALNFTGSYVDLAWRPRGESRAYDRETGSLGRVRLGKHRMAVELGARYTHVSLSDGPVDGGVFNRTSVGVTWYGPYELRAQVDYGYATLDRSGALGRTQLLTTRVQWELR
jgi:phosphate-selective porin